MLGCCPQVIDEALHRSSPGLDANDVFVPRVERKHLVPAVSIPTLRPWTLHPYPFHVVLPISHTDRRSSTDARRRKRI
jgi:hypothetical protein